MSGKRILIKISGGLETAFGIVFHNLVVRMTNTYTALPYRLN